MGQRIPSKQTRKGFPVGISVATGTLGMESVRPGDAPRPRHLQSQEQRQKVKEKAAAELSKALWSEQDVSHVSQSRCAGQRS